jgi:hypothetical protein
MRANSAMALSAQNSPKPGPVAGVALRQELRVEDFAGVEGESRKQCGFGD